MILVLPRHFFELLVQWSKLKQMPGIQSPSLSQMRSVVVGILILSAYLFWEAWRVISYGGMTNVYCGGALAKSSCLVGSWLGRVLFGARNEHWGFALIHFGAGVFIGVAILRLYVRERKKYSAGGLAK